MSAAAPVFFLDEFASRQWSDPNYSGTRLSCDQADLVARAEAAVASGAALVDGYAPFCKHLFLPNFCGAQPGAVEITAANRSLLRSGYGARTPSELPVLQRWFSAADVGPLMPAKYLDLILYSREQLVKERAATGRSDAPPLPDAPWGIISVKAQDADFELPMQPSASRCVTFTAQTQLYRSYRDAQRVHRRRRKRRAHRPCCVHEKRGVLGNACAGGGWRTPERGLRQSGHFPVQLARALYSVHGECTAACPICV